MALRTREIIFLICFLFTIYSVNGQTQHQKNLRNEISCTTKMLVNPEGGDSIILKTCAWHNYKFVETGEPDYKGRYSYVYELFVLKGDSARKINNSDIFNEKVRKLERVLNTKIKRIFDDNAKDPELKECMKDEVYKKIDINEMGLSFDENGDMEFSVSFGLGGACFNVDGTSVSLSLKEIAEYIQN